MNINKYFVDNDGMGVISTVSAEGIPNSAIYAKPHIMGDDTLAFIMRDRLTHSNLKVNPNANYMFLEHRHGFNGVRLSLVKIEETCDRERINKLSRRNRSLEDDEESRFLVTFKVTKALTLIGGREILMK